MKVISIVLLLSTGSMTSFAQNIKAGFPSYHQIIPKFENMMDYVQQGDGQIMTVNASLLDKNIFDYPENSVVYYLNGKKTFDVEYVKKLIDLNASLINHISTDEIRKDGKRIIRIDYRKKVDTIQK